MFPSTSYKNNEAELYLALSGIPIGKSNLLFQCTKDSKEPIFQISVDILSNTNFFQAFTASANVPAIYLDKPRHPSSANSFESSLKTNVDHESCDGKSYYKDPTFFSQQGNHKASEEPKEETIQQSSYYLKYLKMVAENTKKTPQESASMQPVTTRTTPKKPTITTLVKQSKPAHSPTKKPSKHKLPQKVRKGKPTFQLVDEDDEAQQESIPHEEGNDPDLELAKKLSLETPQEKGEGEGDDGDLEWAIKLSLDPAFLPQGRALIRVIVYIYNTRQIQTLYP
ncbi:hypothetical protein Tco_0144607 [Tanacetum coccineum]